MSDHATPPSPDLTPADLALAVEANTIDYYRNFGRVAGAELHEEPGLLWLRTGVQDEMFNGVLQARLEPEAADAAIARMRETFSRARLPMTWHTSPSTRPGDLGERLLAHGFELADREPGMAADLSCLAEPCPAPRGLTIEPVVTEAALDAWLRVWILPGPATAVLLEACFRLYAALALDPGGALTFFLGRLDGRPAGISALWVSAGAASVQHVVTVREARRQGIGAAMTLAALHAARTRGYRVAVLTASAMGRGVYERIGFRECCVMCTYHRRSE